MASPALQRASVAPASSLQNPSTPTTSTSTSTATAGGAFPLDAFASDPTFSAFLSPSFDSTRFSSTALSSGSAASTAEKLQDGIRLLEKQLRSEVLHRHSDLLNQLSSLKDAESALSTIRAAVSSLQLSVLRSRSEIADPHRHIKSKTIQLSNLHCTTDLLQHSIRALRLSKKLRDLASGDPDRLDLSKAAQLHSEILSLCSENDLAGIDIINDELASVSEIGSRLRSDAMKVLERGMDGLNQAEVGTGLQVFYNLGELRQTVDALINKYKSQGVKSVSMALDMKAISASSGGGFGPGGIRGSGTPQIGGGAKAKEAL